MRYFYAKKNRYGLGLTRDSIGWQVARFTSREARDAYVANHRYNRQGNIQICLCSCKTKDILLHCRVHQSIVWVEEDGTEWGIVTW